MKKQTKVAAKTAKTKKAKPSFKLDAKRSAKMDELLENADGEEESTGLIAQILMLFTKGFAKKEIVAYGYNKSTVYRQCRELEKLKKAPALEYFGHDLFERRVQKYMKSKGVARDKAVEALIEKDVE